jgi:transcriptional regulator with XRE-family HTH domain
VQDELRKRFRKRRLKLDLTQVGLAKRSGVALPTLRRFERTGQIGLEALLNIALVLECLADFDRIAVEDEQSVIGRPLDVVLGQKRGRRKGRIT